MTSTSEIVTDALGLILADEADIGIEPNEFSQSVRILNDFAAEQFHLGVDFGYRPVVTSGDLITSPKSVNLALKQNLAVLIAPIFGAPVDADLRINAKESLKSLKALFLKNITSSFPPNMPMGSGNSNAGFASSAFYPLAQPDSILRLNASTTITIAAINTPVIIDSWTVDRSNNVTALAAGTVEYLQDEPFLAMLEASFTVAASGTDQFTFYFRKNGALLQQSQMVFDASVDQIIIMKWAETMRRGDKVSSAVENNSDTSDVVLTAGHFTVN